MSHQHKAVIERTFAEIAEKPRCQVKETARRQIQARQGVRRDAQASRKGLLFVSRESRLKVKRTTR